jgi:hypothetical protein
MTIMSIASDLRKIDREIMNSARARLRVRMAEMSFEDKSLAPERATGRIAVRPNSRRLIVRRIRKSKKVRG